MIAIISNVIPFSKQYYDTILTASTIGIIALVTGLVRALPYLLFGGKRELPKIVSYLGASLPPSIMVILAAYCLRNINLTSFPYGMAELISVAVVVALQIWKKNTVASILIGTISYMVLIRTVFPL